MMMDDETTGEVDVRTPDETDGRTLTIDLLEDEQLTIDTLDIDVLPSGDLVFEASGTITALESETLSVLAGDRLEPAEITFNVRE